MYKSHVISLVLPVMNKGPQALPMVYKFSSMQKAQKNSHTHFEGSQSTTYSLSSFSSSFLLRRYKIKKSFSTVLQLVA